MKHGSAQSTIAGARESMTSYDTRAIMTKCPTGVAPDIADEEIEDAVSYVAARV